MHNTEDDVVLMNISRGKISDISMIIVQNPK